MALKVCNVCTATWYAGENCPQCLQVGRGEVRDYHFSFEEAPSAAVPAEAGGSVSEEEGTGDTQSLSEQPPPNPDDLDSEGQLDTGTDDDEDLTEHSRNHLSRIASERGLDASGTKAELLARLQGASHG